MRRGIRLLQIVDSLQAGGMENVAVQVMNGLDPERFEVTVCCLSTEGPFAGRLSPAVRKVALHKPPGFQWNTVRELRRLMQEGFDVVHTHHLGGLIYTALARGMMKRPRIVHSEHIILHGWELDWKRHWQRRVLYGLADRVFTVSGQQLQQLREHGLQHPAMFTLHNGVDCARFCPLSESKAEIRRRLGLDPDGFWIAKVARFATAKRHLELIEAFEVAAVKVAPLRLLLLGDGGIEKDKVLKRLEASPARSKIHWAGLQQDPVPWYQAMDALIIASVNEGLPNVALEAMACGLPILSNDVCGIHEVARPGEHAWIEDLNTVPLLAAAIGRFASLPPEELDRMGKAGREHVQHAFSLDAMMAKYDRLYSSVAAT